jgi:hypothetical protein
MSKNGLILLTPTSIAYTGTSATISANGSVTFSACTAVSLNGVFSADYDNYMVVMRETGTVNQVFQIRLRASGTDASDSGHTHQLILAGSTTVAAQRDGGQTAFRISNTSNVLSQGHILNFYGPHLAQPTALRSVSVCAISNAYIFDVAQTHSVSSSYDGFSLLPNAAGNITGRVAVYGMRK